MLTPGWVGIVDGVFKDTFIHQLRRLYVVASMAADESETFEKDKNIAEIIGFYTNPKFMSVLKEQERNTKKDPRYEEKLRRAISGTLIPTIK